MELLKQNLQQTSTEESYKSYLSFFKTYILPHLPENKGMKILDIGCGPGHLLYVLNKEGYKNCLGIDSSQTQIDNAKKKLDNVVLRDALQYLSEHKNEFDIITMFDFVEHFDKKTLFTLLKLVNHSLRTNGLVIIHTTNGWSPFSRFYFFSDLTHQELYSPKTLGDALFSTGFRNCCYFPSEPEYLRKPESFFSLRSLIWFFLRIVRWILWRLISRTYALIEYIGVVKFTGIYTPNFIIVCEKDKTI